MKTLTSRIFSFVVAATSLVFVNGCAPRGEAHSVEQILNDARSGYSQMSQDVAPDVATALKGLTGSLDKLAGLGGGGDARQVSGSIAEGLNTLITRSGFTQRPAMAELINQYRSLSTATGAPVALGAPNLKLAVARTYTILTAELTSTKFKL
jgi:hypothetical protein